MIETITCHGVEELDAIAEKLLKKYPQQRVFAFYGGMGAGKTTFIKSLCNHLQVTDVVSSPTFAIVNVYNTQIGQQIFHFDLYRLKKEQELLDIDYEDYFFSGNYCFIEWPELFEQLIPEEAVKVRISQVADSNTERDFTF